MRPAALTLLATGSSSSPSGVTGSSSIPQVESKAVARARETGICRYPSLRTCRGSTSRRYAGSTLIREDARDLDRQITGLPKVLESSYGMRLSPYQAPDRAGRTDLSSVQSSCTRHRTVKAILPAAECAWDKRIAPANAGWAGAAQLGHRRHFSRCGGLSSLTSISCCFLLFWARRGGVSVTGDLSAVARRQRYGGTVHVGGTGRETVVGPT